MFTKELHAVFVQHGSCPNCGAAIKWGLYTGEIYCPNCKKRVIIRNNEAVGTK